MTSESEFKAGEATASDTGRKYGYSTEPRNVSRWGPYIISQTLISGPETWELVSQAPRLYIFWRCWRICRAAIQEWKNLSDVCDLCASSLFPANCEYKQRGSSVQATCQQREIRERTSLRHPAQILMGYALGGKQP